MLGRGCKYDSTTRLYEEPGSIAKRNQKLACFIMVARCRNRECETVSRLLVLSSHTRGPAGRPAVSPWLTATYYTTRRLVTIHVVYLMLWKFQLITLGLRSHH